MKKICKDCGIEKEKTDFYGIQGECKNCSKLRISKNYRENIKYYKTYDIKRNQDPERKAKRLDYQRKQRQLNPYKYLARNTTLREIKRGNLTKLPCEVCGNKKVEAHHEDHRKPLDVKWLCKKHHFEADKLLNNK